MYSLTRSFLLSIYFHNAQISLSWSPSEYFNFSINLIPLKNLLLQNMSILTRLIKWHCLYCHSDVIHQASDFNFYIHTEGFFFLLFQHVNILKGYFFHASACICCCTYILLKTVFMYSRTLISETRIHHFLSTGIYLVSL